VLVTANIINISLKMKCNLFFLLEAQWAEPVSLTFHSAFEEINQPETRIAYGSHDC
jgi:hypothetical protein